MHPEASDKIAEYYESYLSNPSIDLVKKMDLPSTHAVVSDHVGTNCGHSDDRLYLENCDFDRYFKSFKNASIRSDRFNIFVDP